MAQGSSIGWTEATWNPAADCMKVSKGCEVRYAASLSAVVAVETASSNCARRAHPRSPPPRGGFSLLSTLNSITASVRGVAYINTAGIPRFKEKPMTNEMTSRLTEEEIQERIDAIQAAEYDTRYEEFADQIREEFENKELSLRVEESLAAFQERQKEDLWEKIEEEEAEREIEEEEAEREAR